MPETDLKTNTIERLKQLVSNDGGVSPIGFLLSVLPKSADVYVFGGAIRNILIDECHGYRPVTGDIDIVVGNGDPDLDISSVLPSDHWKRTALGGIRWRPAHAVFSYDISFSRRALPA